MHLSVPTSGDNPLDPQFLDFFLKGNLSLEKAKRGEPFKGYSLLP